MKKPALAGVIAAFALALLSVPAAADSGTGFAPFPTCHPFIPKDGLGPGFPPSDLASTGPCAETDHFGKSFDVAVPDPTQPCSPPVPLAILGTGNGIQHSNVNNADDWWITSTFEGSFSAYQLLGFGAQGPVLGPLFATGHEEEWFGDSLNANNFVDHAIMNLNATLVSGQTMSIHGVFHNSSTGGNPFQFGVPPFAQASNSFFKVSC